MSADRFDELLSLFLANSGSDDELAELMQLLESSEELRERAAEQLLVDRLSHESAKKSLSAERILRALPTQSKSSMSQKVLLKTVEYEASRSKRIIQMRTRMIVGIAASVALIFGLFQFVSQPESNVSIIAQVEKIEAGTAWLIPADNPDTRKPVTANLNLQSGDRIEVDYGGEVVLAYQGESTRVYVSGDSNVVLATKGSPGSESKFLSLLQGELKADVAPQPKGRPLVVKTSHAEMTVVGTIFSVTSGETQSKLKVEEGLVRMQSLAGGKPIDVGVNEWALAKEGKTGIVMPGQLVEWYQLRKFGLFPERQLPHGIASNERQLWILSEYGTRISEINFASKTTSKNFTLSHPLHEYSNLVFDGQLLWGNDRDDSTVLRGFDLTGKLIKSFPLADSVDFLTGINRNRAPSFTFGNGYLWVGLQKRLYKISPTTGTLIAEFEMPLPGPGHIHSMAFCGDSLYLGSVNWISRIHPDDGRVINSFYYRQSGSASRMAGGPGSSVWLTMLTNKQLHLVQTDQSTLEIKTTKGLPTRPEGARNELPSQ